MFIPAEIRRVILGGGESRLLCLDAAAPGEALDEYRGQAQAVYLDPPFMTGGQLLRQRPFGEEGWRSDKPGLSYPGYSDRFASRDAYLSLLRGLLETGRGLLTDSGVLALHLDWRASAYARVLGDELFGEDCFINEVIWGYDSGGRSRRSFSRKHDTILFWGKTKDWRFRIDRVPVLRVRKKRSHLRRGVDEDGRAYGAITVGGREYRYYDDDPAYPGDVWTDISHLQQRDPERNGYPTQKPLRLLERVLKPLAEPGELVCELCCGGGTGLAAAQAIGCRFLGVDTAPEALAVCEARLDAPDLTVDAPCLTGGAELSGMADPARGVVMLSGFSCPHPAFPAQAGPMDALEGWYAGVLRDGVLHASEFHHRSRRKPELPPMAFLREAEGPVGVLCVDAAGRRHGFVWQG